jgi:hypothetical protein
VRSCRPGQCRWGQPTKPVCLSWCRGHLRCGSWRCTSLREPLQFLSFVGLVPSERTTGDTVRPSFKVRIARQPPWNSSRKLRAQRRNRFKTENHLPKYSGRSSEGQPVPQSISAPPDQAIVFSRATWIRFFGTSGTIRPRCSSFNTRRIRLTSIHPVRMPLSTVIQR